MQLAGCIIKNKEGKVLLLHRNTAKRVQWEIPGGKVEPGEMPEQAAVRELAEELGVAVRQVHRIGGKVFTEDGQQHQYDWFAAKIITGEPRLAEPDTFDRLQYFSLDEMRHIPDQLSANTKNFATRTEQGK